MPVRAPTRRLWTRRRDRAARALDKLAAATDRVARAAGRDAPAADLKPARRTTRLWA